MGGRAAVAGGPLVPARGRRGHARSRLVPLPPAARLAAARGRGAAALPRPSSARRDVPGRARGARRRTAPLPAGLDSRAPRPRPRRAEGGVGVLRGREPAGGRPPAGAARRPGACADGDARRRNQLDVPLPRRLRPHVQPLPLHRRALVPRAAARARPRRPVAMGALGARDPGDGRHPSLRRARARVAGSVRRRRTPRPAARGRLGVRRRRRARDPVLAHRSRAGGPVRRGGRGGKPARRGRVRLAGGRRLHRRLPRAPGGARGRGGGARRALTRGAAARRRAPRSSRSPRSSSHGAPALRRRAT